MRRRATPARTPRSSTTPATTSRRATAKATRAGGMEEQQAQHEQAVGSCNARGIGIGQLFSLSEHRWATRTRSTWSPTAQLRDRRRRLGVGHAADARACTMCALTMLRSAVPFRPPRTTPKPIVQGPQTAVVVGPAGRGDLHRQVRPREGAVPLGPPGQARREQLVLDPRVAGLGRQGLGRRSTSRASARR